MLLIGSVDSEFASKHHFGLEQALTDVLKKQQYQHQHGDTSMEKKDHLQNENKNQGLINTIVNHNNKLKNIDNKYNFIVNNYANSSHVKEVIEKQKNWKTTCLVHLHSIVRGRSSY
jgi:galactitol-specific phosphotransferase system IIB component